MVMTFNLEGGHRQGVAGRLLRAADQEELIAGPAKEKRAIVVMVQESGLNETFQQHTSNRLQSLGFLTYHCTCPTNENPAGSGVYIALDNTIFTDEDVLAVYDIVPGQAMAIEVGSGEGSITLVNIHGPRFGDNSWTKKKAFWSEIIMFVAAKSRAGAHPVLVGGDFNLWMDRLGHATTQQFMDVWLAEGFMQLGREEELDQGPSRGAHRLDSFLMNGPLLAWASKEDLCVCPSAARGLLGSDHAPVLVSVPMAVNAPGMDARVPFTHMVERLCEFDPISPQVTEVAAQHMQATLQDAKLRPCLGFSPEDTLTQQQVTAVFRYLEEFRDRMADTVGTRRPPQRQADHPQASHLAKDVTLAMANYTALAERAAALWGNDARIRGVRSMEAQRIVQELRKYDKDFCPATMEALQEEIDKHTRRLEQHVADLRQKLADTRKSSIKDFWQRAAPDIKLRWEALRGALRVMSYSPSALWCVCTRDRAEKVIADSEGVLAEVHSLRHTLYTPKELYLPYFAELVKKHVPRGTAEDWEEVLTYMQDDMDRTVKETMAAGKAPGSNRVTAALIHALPRPLQKVLVMAFQAILRGADPPDTWMEALVWLLPKTALKGYLDAYRPIALGQRDMCMLMTPLMERFTTVLRRKGMSCDIQFGAMPGATPAAPIYLAQQQLKHFRGWNYVMSFDVSKAFDTAPHGALAYLPWHMGVPESIIALFPKLGCESSVRIVTAHGLTAPVVLRRGLRQGSAESAVLFALLLEPMLRELDARSGGNDDLGCATRALVQAYCDDILLVAHDLRRFTELAGLVADYLRHMGMELNVQK